MFKQKRSSCFRRHFVVSTVFLLMIVVFGKGAIGQVQQISNDSLRKYLQNRDWPKEYACAMFVELTVDTKAESTSSFSEYWYLYSQSVDLKALRLDSQQQSKFSLSGELGRGPTTSFYASGDDSFLYVGTVILPTEKPDNIENPSLKLEYCNPFNLNFLGWSSFRRKEVPSARPDSLKRIFERYEETGSKKHRNLQICEFKVFPDDVLFDTVMFDAQFGNMPVSLVRKSRNGGRSEFSEKIEASWKSNDGSHWFPHEVTIDTIIDQSTRKSWTIKYYWKVADLEQKIFDPSNGGALPLEQLRNLIVATAFNRR